MDTSTIKSGFRVKAIILVDSNFHREDHLDFSNKIVTDMDIHTNVQVKNNHITVLEEVLVKQNSGNKEQISISVKMAGMFECIGDTQIPNLDEFGRVNAAAIIFPYIREHISSLSVKAGAGAIILPPVNFAALSENTKE